MTSNTKIRADISTGTQSINQEIEKTRKFTRQCLRDPRVTSPLYDELVKALQSSSSHLRTSNFSILIDVCTKVVIEQKCRAPLTSHHEENPSATKIARKIIKLCHRVAYSLNKASVINPSTIFDEEAKKYFENS